MFDLSNIGADIEEVSADNFISDDENRFEYWYPVVETLDIPRPETMMIDFPIGLYGVAVGEPLPDAEMSDDEAKSAMTIIIQQIREFGEHAGYPLFVRNSYTSHKHDWDKSCFISDKMSDEDIIESIYNLAYFNACALPHLGLKLVVRSFIATSPVFYAFDGNMPITQEYRLFYEDGEPVFWQAYWPEEAFDDQKLFIIPLDPDSQYPCDDVNSYDVSSMKQSTDDWDLSDVKNPDRSFTKISNMDTEDSNISDTTDWDVSPIKQSNNEWDFSKAKDYNGLFTSCPNTDTENTDNWDLDMVEDPSKPDDNQVVFNHKEWDLSALQNKKHDIDQDDVRRRLQKISTPSSELMETMKQYAKMVTDELGGFWSVDFLIDRNGTPYLIDMALGNQSYQSKDKKDFT